MFNYAIFRKTLSDSGWSIILSSAGLVSFVVLFAWAMLNMGTDLLKFVAKYPFIQKIFEMGFGINVSGEVSIVIMFAVCFTHAVVLALTWSVVIATTTRITAGEIERGTADMLLTLPVSRSEVYLSSSLVWVLAVAVLSFCPILGIAIAVQIFETPQVVDVNRYFAPAINFYCLNLAVGGISSMIACCLNRRGPAIGAIVGIVLVSVVLNFLEPFIAVVKHIRFLSLLSYFRPVEVVRSGAWPATHMAVLVGIALVSWIAGLVVFARKDIPTA